MIFFAFVIYLAYLFHGHSEAMLVKTIASNILELSVDEATGNATLHLGSYPDPVLMPQPSIFLSGAWRRIGQGLTVVSLSYAPGNDEFGSFDALELRCQADLSIATTGEREGAGR